MEYELKKILNKLILLCFDNITDEVMKSYKYFKVSLSKKEVKINEKYENREIVLFNIYRSESELMNSLIMALAHHIDFCERGETDNKQNFMSIYRNLLSTALNYGFIVLEDLQNSDDFKNTKKIRDTLSDFWLTKASGVKNKIEVYDCFSIKTALKEKKYEFNQLSRAWEKKVDYADVRTEVNYLQVLNSKVIYQVVTENKATINIFGKITVEGKTYAYKDILHESGYRFSDGNWKKGINASLYLLEKKEILAKLPKGQGIKVSIEY